MESEHGVERDGDLNAHPFIDLIGDQIFTSGKKLSSSSSSSSASSSSPDYPLGNPFQDYEIELPDSFIDLVGVQFHKNDQLAAKDGGNDVFKSSNPEIEQPSHELLIPNSKPAITSDNPKFEQPSHETEVPDSFIDLFGVQFHKNAHSAAKNNDNDIFTSSTPELEQPSHDIELPDSLFDLVSVQFHKIAAKNGENDDFMSSTPEVEQPSHELLIPHLQPAAATSDTPKFEQPSHELLVPKLVPEGTSDIPELSLSISSTTNSPPVQTMERSDESSYRIPPSVFVSAKSTNPIEWSVASNDSLFSIHMGNLSFRQDNLFWLPPEPDMHGQEYSKSGQLLNFHPPQNEATGNKKSSDGSYVAEAPVETMEEVVPRENAEDRWTQNSSLATSISRHSDASTNSIKSFSFPILAGDAEKGASLRITGPLNLHMEHKKIPSAVRPQFEPYSPVTVQPVPRAEKAHTRWFSCFSCCCCCRRLCP